MHPIYEAIEQAMRVRSYLAHSHSRGSSLSNQSLMDHDSRRGLTRPQQHQSPGLFLRRKGARLAVRFLYRALLTASITVIGYTVPHFSLISGLNGAISYWPIQVRQLLNVKSVVPCMHSCSTITCVMLDVSLDAA